MGKKEMGKKEMGPRGNLRKEDRKHSTIGEERVTC